jgi:hypothetical protein
MITQRAALNTLHELRYGDLKALSKNVNRADARLLSPVLQLADVDTPKSGQFSEIRLIPAPRRPQLADAPSQPNAHVYCHIPSVCVSL